MKNFLFFLIAASLFACNAGSKDSKLDNNATPNTLTEEQKKDGWQLLFDGTTTNGWHKYGNKKIGTSWKVADGSIYLDTTEKATLPNGKPGWQIKDGGDIVSDSSYDNFHLKLEWKIAKGGNSGIIFYVNEDTAKYDYVWKTGPEMQVLDDAEHSDGKLQKKRASNLYGLIECTNEAQKPLKAVGEWNLAEIKSTNGKLDFYLNGTNVVSTTLWDDAWTKLVAGSKFKDFPGFGTYKTGHIALQDHGNLVWYRNVMVKKL